MSKTKNKYLTHVTCGWTTAGDYAYQTLEQKAEYLATMVRRTAYIKPNGVQVGCAVIDERGNLYHGSNSETVWHKGIHAEVAALTAMLSAGFRKPQLVVIASDRKLFTPCGECCDWIYMLGGPQCKVTYLNVETGKKKSWRMGQLMPHYPKK